MNIEQLKQILEQGEKIGATHYSGGSDCYYKERYNSDAWEYCLFGDRCFKFDPDDYSVDSGIRALSDIKTIVELSEQVEQLKVKVEQISNSLERDINNSNNETASMVYVKAILEELQELTK